MPETFLREEIDSLLHQDSKKGYFELSGGVLEELSQKNGRDEKDDFDSLIRQLADIFQVSSMAMTYRVGNLNLFDAL
ncbi:MAG: hypothetical protein MI974_12800 [Chitinophagales bacterium]|nr:hypothetical protein [Chitinophagales bacterium]